MIDKNIESLYTNDKILSSCLKKYLSTKCLNERLSHDSIIALGNSLQMTTVQRIENNANVFAITDAIQKCLPVSRFYVSGPSGRGVSIGVPQTDIYVFLCTQDCFYNNNIYNKMFDQLMSNLLEILSTKKNLIIDPVVYSIKAKNAKKSIKVTPYLQISINESIFRIYLAPALGYKPDTQKKASCLLMQELYEKSALDTLLNFYPALIEKPSEEIAHEKPEIHSFIRFCQYWIILLNVTSLDSYAIEVLALRSCKDSLAVDNETTDRCKKIYQRLHNSIDKSNIDFGQKRLDVLLAFLIFLDYLKNLQNYTNSYFKTNHTKKFLTDNHNPYLNLLYSLSKSDSAKLSNKSVELLKYFSTTKYNRITLGSVLWTNTKSSTKSSILLYIFLFIFLGLLTSIPFINYRIYSFILSEQYDHLNLIFQLISEKFALGWIQGKCYSSLVFDYVSQLILNSLN